MRLAVVCDYLEEGWPSMDLMAEMLVMHAKAFAEVDLVRPAMPRWPWGAAAPGAFERGFGRYLAYPIRVLRERQRHQLFHIADHSYAHLVLALPERRTGVYCHDLDAFPAASSAASASAWRRVLGDLLLLGLRRASIVFYSTEAVRAEILARRLLPAERLVHAPPGVSSEFVPAANEYDREWAARGPYLLHVGSLIPRKDPEFLLRLFARLAAKQRDLMLVQIGGHWSRDQARLQGELGISGRVLQRQGLSREELAAAYRCARAVVLPSKAEGFGLPVIEALACGSPVVASDLPVLREVGGSAVDFCHPGELEQWHQAIDRRLHEGSAGREERLGWASRYSWQQHARTIVNAYKALE